MKYAPFRQITQITMFLIELENFIVFRWMWRPERGLHCYKVLLCFQILAASINNTLLPCALPLLPTKRQRFLSHGTPDRNILRCLCSRGNYLVNPAFKLPRVFNVKTPNTDDMSDFKQRQPAIYTKTYVSVETAATEMPRLQKSVFAPQQFSCCEYSKLKPGVITENPFIDFGQPPILSQENKPRV